MADAGVYAAAKRRRRRGGGGGGSPTGPFGGGGGGGGGGGNTGGGGGGGQSPGTIPTAPPTHSTRDPSNVFPNAPYVPVAELTIQQQLREQLSAQPPKKSTFTAASNKFSHYLTISTMESEAAPLSLDPGIRTQTHHTVNRYNGKHVLLRRFVDAHITPETCGVVFDHLRHFRHPNLVTLQGIVATSEFVLGHNDVLVEYRYIRGARTLQETFFPPPPTAGAPPASPVEVGEVTEALLWSFACQLTGLVRAFHEAGVPLRGLHLTKVLYLEVGQRVMFSGLGIQDLICGGPASKEHLEKALRADVISLGLLLLKLATRNPQSFNADALNKTTTVSHVLQHFISTCIEGNSKIEDLCRGLGERMSIELGHQLGYSDFLLHECAKELHNGRMLKLLMRLNFAYAATSDPNTDPMDGFAIRSLYQHLFNQVDDSSVPKYDWGHAYYCLNKLDTRCDDLVQLMNQTDLTLLVISWRDLRTLLDRVTVGMTSGKSDGGAAPGAAPGVTA